MEEAQPSLNVLVVDDASVVQRLITHWLDQIMFCNMNTASDGLEAIEILEKSYKPDGARFDLVITDLIMPKAEGWSVVEYIRNTKNDKDLSIIVLSTQADTEVQEKAKNLGVNAYLSKPLGYQELLRCILSLFSDKWPARR